METIVFRCLYQCVDIMITSWCFSSLVLNHWVLFLLRRQGFHGNSSSCTVPPGAAASALSWWQPVALRAACTALPAHQSHGKIRPHPPCGGWSGHSRRICHTECWQEEPVGCCHFPQQQLHPWRRWWYACPVSRGGETPSLVETVKCQPPETRPILLPAQENKCLMGCWGPSSAFYSSDAATTPPAGWKRQWRSAEWRAGRQEVAESSEGEDGDCEEHQHPTHASDLRGCNPAGRRTSRHGRCHSEGNIHSRWDFKQNHIRVDVWLIIRADLHSLDEARAVKWKSHDSR